MNYNLKLELFFEKPGNAEAVFLSLKPEVGLKHEKRSSTTMRLNKNVLLLNVNASDKKALKASLESYLKLAALAEKIVSEKRR